MATSFIGVDSSGDTKFHRDASGIFAQRNGVNPQTLRIYNTYTDASNYERAKISWNSNVLEIGTESAGTGTARGLVLQTNSLTQLTIAANGIITTTNALYIGSTANGIVNASAAGTGSESVFTCSQPYSATAGSRTIFSSTNSFQPTSGTLTYTGVGIAPTINQTGGANGITRGVYVNPTLTAAANWRSIETSNNTGYAIYTAGTANSYFGGNVGIGTTSPATLFHVSTATAEVDFLTFTASGQTMSLKYMATPNSFVFTSSSGRNINFNNSGNVGVGFDTAPSQKLHVSGNVRVTGAYYDSNNEPGTSGQVLKSTATGTDWVDPSTLTGINADFVKGVEGNRFVENLQTGVLYGGVITVNALDNSKVDISAGVGIIVSAGASTTALPIPTVTTVTWTAKTAVTLTYLATSEVTWFSINSSGNVVQSSSAWSDSGYETELPLGVAVHPNNTSISFAKPAPHLSYGQSTLVDPFVRAFGPLKLSGNTISAYSTNLQISRSSGTSYSIGSNYLNDPNNPNIVSDTNASPIGAVHYYFKNGSGGFNIQIGSLVDPTKYDNGSGTLQTASGGKYTIQRIFSCPTQPTLIGIYYGGEEYNSIQAAEANIPYEVFSESELTSNQGVFCGYLIVKSNTTNLSNTADAKFIQAGLFRSISTVTAGGQAITSLDDLTDVVITSPVNGNFLRYNSANSSWVNGTGVDGTGTTNYVPKWSDSDTLANSLIFDNGTNVGIGTISTLARLHVKGSGNTSATFGINLEDSAGVHVFRVRDDGGIHVGPTTGASSGAFISPSDGTDNIGTTTSSGLRYRSALGTSVAGADHYFRNYQGNRQFSSGTGSLVQVSAPFYPTSGTGVWAGIQIDSIINQTGGANGITRGLWVNSNLIAAANYRAIETNNNSGWAFYGSGTAPSYFAGNVGIGTTTTNAPLQFANTTVNRKIVLWDTNNNDHQFYGLGISSGILRYQASSTLDNHVFYAGASVSSSNELMRITGGGLVGINRNPPGGMLHMVCNAAGTKGLIVQAATSQTANLQEWQNSAGTPLSYIQPSGVFRSDITTGTAPFTVASTTVVTNLNADLLDGQHGSYYTTYVQSRLQNLVTNGSGLLGNNTNFSTITFNAAERFSGGGSFVYNGADNAITNDELIPVDIGKIHRYTYYAKLLSKSEVSETPTHYGMVVSYDADGLLIQPFNCQKVVGSTYTTLALPLNPGDPTITLTNATGWYSGPNSHQRTIGFHPYTNGQGYTYPDYTYTRNYMVGAWAEGGISGNVITLAVPYSGVARPAGTKVANHQSGGTYDYIAGGNVPTQTSWTKYEGVIGPTGSFYSALTEGTTVSSTGDMLTAPGGFRHGVAFMRIGWLLSYNTPVGTAQTALSAISFGLDPRYDDFYRAVSDGSAISPSFSFTNDTNTGMFRPATDEIGFSTSASERMRITAAGNVVIGATTTSDKFRVAGGNIQVDAGYGIRCSDNFRLYDATNSIDRFLFSSNNIYNTRNSGSHIFQHNGSQTAVLNSSGNMGIGVVSPTAKLDITGQTGATGYSLLLRSGEAGAGTSAIQIAFGFNASSEYRHAIRTRHNSAAAANNAIDFWLWQQGVDAAGTVGSLRAMTIDGANGGSVGIGTASPSQRAHIFGGSLLINKTVANDDKIFIGSLIADSDANDRLRLTPFKLMLNSNTQSFTISGDNLDYSYMILYSRGHATNAGQVVIRSWSNAAGPLLTYFTPTGVGIGASAPTVTLDVAGSAELKNGLTAQAFRVYNTYTDGSNYERAKFVWSSNVLQIGTENAGTGTSRSMEFQTAGVTRATLSNDGYFSIGVAASSSYRLLVKGASDVSGYSAGFTNQSDQNLFRISNPGVVEIGNDNQKTSFYPYSSGAGIDGFGTLAQSGDLAICFSSNRTTTGGMSGGVVSITRSASETQTSGLTTYLVVGQLPANSFAPTSGTGTWVGAYIRARINQTGGASGITRGLYVNPVLTAAADWRSVETGNNSGWAFYGAGTAQSYFGGNVGIGASPSTLLEVSGANGSNIIRSTTTTNLGTTAWAGVTAHDIQFYNADPSGAGIYSAIRIIGSADSGVSGGGTAQYDFTIWTGGYNNTLSERLRVNSIGNVGIGTTDPQYSLDVYSSSSVFGNGDNGRIIITDDYYGGELGIMTDNDEILASKHSDGTFRYGGGAPGYEPIVVSGSYVGINTDTPGSELDVKGTLRLSGSSSGYVGFAPAAAAGSTTYTLPSADGSNGQALTTNGSATLSWATVSSASGYSVSSVSTTTNVSATSGEIVYLVNATSGSVTMNLPTAVGNTAKITVKKTDSSANTVVVDANSTQTIDGSLTKTIEFQYTSITLISDNANWFII
jgi:hypothetical protein